jgi:head-tail adaptor
MDFIPLFSGEGLSGKINGKPLPIKINKLGRYEQMEKKNVEIMDYEDKKSQAGKRYTRFKTNLGWMSAFDKELIENLKKFEGKAVSISFSIDEEKGWKNIRTMHGAAEGEVSSEAPKEASSERTVNRNATMYVSYAKDIFVALENKDVEVKSSAEELMELAIQLVNQAKKAFE